MNFINILNEKIRRMPDNDVDEYISKNWKNVITIEYNAMASIELDRLLKSDVVVNSEQDYMHINGDISKDMLNSVKDILKKYKIEVI